MAQIKGSPIQNRPAHGTRAIHAGLSRFGRNICCQRQDSIRTICAGEARSAERRVICEPTSCRRDDALVHDRSPFRASPVGQGYVCQGKGFAGENFKDAGGVAAAEGNGMPAGIEPNIIGDYNLVAQRQDPVTGKRHGAAPFDRSTHVGRCQIGHYCICRCAAALV